MDQFDQAIKRAERRKATEPSAVAARYDRKRDRIVVELSSGAEFAFPRLQAQGLEEAKPADLNKIEITPSGFGLHFPTLDADLWLPALLDGIFGTRQWMAAQLGARGGKAKSKAKARAARINGQLGGRPRKSRTNVKAGRADPKPDVTSHRKKSSARTRLRASAKPRG